MLDRKLSEVYSEPIRIQNKDVSAQFAQKRLFF